MKNWVLTEDLVLWVVSMEVCLQVLLLGCRLMWVQKIEILGFAAQEMVLLPCLLLWNKKKKKGGQVVKQGIKEKATLKNNNKSWQHCANPSLFQGSSLWLRNIDGLAGDPRPCAGVTGSASPGTGDCPEAVTPQGPHTWVSLDREFPSLVLLWCHSMEEVKTRSDTACFAAGLFSLYSISDLWAFSQGIWSLEPRGLDVACWGWRKLWHGWWEAGDGFTVLKALLWLPCKHQILYL